MLNKTCVALLIYWASPIQTHHCCGFHSVSLPHTGLIVLPPTMVNCRIRILLHRQIKNKMRKEMMSSNWHLPVSEVELSPQARDETPSSFEFVVQVHCSQLIGPLLCYYLGWTYSVLIQFIFINSLKTKNWQAYICNNDTVSLQNSKKSEWDHLLLCRPPATFGKMLLKNNDSREPLNRDRETLVESSNLGECQWL